MPATDLIERYLEAMKFWLPRKQQEDILAELREDLRLQIEERESVLGHPLAEGDVVALLKQRGSPLRVASGYIQERRLFNPAMLPIYQLVIKIVLLWVLAPLFAIIFVAPILDSARPGAALLEFFSQAVRAGFMTVGIITVVFMLLDRYQDEWIDRWDPRKLPRVTPAHQTSERANDFAGFVSHVAAVIFWSCVMWHRMEFDFNAGTRIVLTPIWNQLFWPIVVVSSARGLRDLFGFLRPGRPAARYWTIIAHDLLVALAAGWLLRVSNWVEIVSPTISAAEVAKAAGWVNGVVQTTLVCVAAIMLLDAILKFRSLRRARLAHPAQVLTAS